ncbi:hypothetical protein ACP4OV_003055 [Aristida adscensionis]
MSARTLLLLVAATAAAVVAFGVAGASTGKYVPGWTPIADVNIPFIQDLGRWAVNETHSVLSFERVVAAGEMLSVEGNGSNYDLMILASPRLGVDEKYLAVVFLEAETEAHKLLSFDAARRWSPPPSPTAS